MITSPCDLPQTSQDVAEVPPRSNTIIEIKRRRGWQIIDWRELYEYRDLFRFLVWRTVKTRYAQTALGFGWAVIQPVVSMVTFTIVFGRLAGIRSDGVPYSVFSLAALVPWTYFANALTDGAQSLVSNSGMISKVYFPRLILPLAAVVSKVIDFGIAFCLLLGLMAWYRIAPTSGVIYLPLVILLMMLTAAGIGMWLTALAIQYRDVNYALGFLVQILMYASPVVYATSDVPEKYQIFYALNPMVGIIEAFRSAMLGTRPMPWDFLLVGTITAILFAVSGSLFFCNRQKVFADVA